ncbi:MAG TPA: hypothetical protein VMI94_11740 [Bryobacteraceae bacterium]|nr:hypothetical protein [Bryobacteraceae bacterium]
MTPRRVLILAALSALCANGADTLSVMGRTWTVPVAADWSAEGGVLRLVTHRGPLPGPRRPIQFALTDVPPYGRLSIEADVMPLERSLMIVFAYIDPAHFDYAHLSIDTAAVQPVHNGIFHVYGGERVRISGERGPAAFAASGRWYHVKLLHDSVTGTVQVAVDGRPVPALRAVDLSLGPGKIGFGSFDETGAFRNIRITVKPKR